MYRSPLESARSGAIVDDVDQAFERYEGNEAVVSILKAEIRAALRDQLKRLPAGYLLLGPKSVGKSELARCAQRAFGVHYLEFEAISVRTLDELIDIIERSVEERAPTTASACSNVEAVQFPPIVVFVDEAHTLPIAVQTGLLRATEGETREVMVTKPRPHRARLNRVCFILATNQKSGLDPAFMTRFRPLNLEALGRDAVARVINRKHPAIPHEIALTLADMNASITREALLDATTFENLRVDHPDMPNEALVSIIRRARGVSPAGLNEIDQKILESLQRSGHASLQHLEIVAGGEDRPEVRRRVTRLVDRGLIGDSSKGLILTSAGELALAELQVRRPAGSRNQNLASFLVEASANLPPETEFARLSDLHIVSIGGAYLEQAAETREKGIEVEIQPFVGQARTSLTETELAEVANRSAQIAKDLAEVGWSNPLNPAPMDLYLALSDQAKTVVKVSPILFSTGLAFNQLIEAREWVSTRKRLARQAPNFQDCGLPRRLGTQNLIILDDLENTQGEKYWVVLGQRSLRRKTMAWEQGAWEASFGEGLVYVDDDTKNGVERIRDCALRGLREEYGSDARSHVVSGPIVTGIGFERTNFDLGVMTLCEVRLPFQEFAKSWKGARDRPEHHELIALPVNRAQLETNILANQLTEEGTRAIQCSHPEEFAEASTIRKFHAFTSINLAVALWFVGAASRPFGSPPPTS